MLNLNQCLPGKMYDFHRDTSSVVMYYTNCVFADQVIVCIIINFDSSLLVINL